jgi:dihydrofolate reductase
VAKKQPSENLWSGLFAESIIPCLFLESAEQMSYTHGNNPFRVIEPGNQSRGNRMNPNTQAQRKLIYSMMVSLDGFVETPKREIDWVIIDEELHQFVNDQQRDIGTYLNGRRMYELMAEYWPTADEDPSNPAVIIEFSQIWKKMPKVVFSKTLDKVEWNARLVKGDFAEEVKKLKAQPGKDLSIGGARLAAECIRLGFVDEYQLFVNPIILGSGTPMFPPLDNKIALELVETRTFGSGVVLLRYQRAMKG